MNQGMFEALLNELQQINRQLAELRALAVAVPVLPLPAEDEAAAKPVAKVATKVAKKAKPKSTTRGVKVA